MDRIDMKRTD